jgi:hypothetical protein
MYVRYVYVRMDIHTNLARSKAEVKRGENVLKPSSRCVSRKLAHQMNWECNTQGKTAANSTQHHGHYGKNPELYRPLLGNDVHEVCIEWPAQPPSGPH